MAKIKKLKLLVFTGALTVLTLLANISAAGACNYFHYQPELPESLANKYAE